MLRAGALTLLLLCTAACGGVGQPAPYDASGIDGLEIPTPSPDPGDFVAAIDNRWFPLVDGATWEYVVEEDGEQVGTLVATVTGVVEVAGLDATGLRTTTRVRGEGRTRVTRYYAQDREGNVWLVGEDGVEGEWRTGDGVPAGLAMPADPRVGDGWTRAEVPGSAVDTVRVVEDLVGDDPEAVTLEELRSGTRTTYAAGVGPAHISDATGTRTTVLVD